MAFPRYESYRDSGVSWLGEVPSHWEVLPFKALFSMSTEKNGKSIIGEMLSVSGYRGIEIKHYEFEEQKRSEAELADYRVVRKGQLVVNTMWLNYAGLGVSDHEGYVSPAYRAYNISSRLHKRYAHYLMRSHVYVDAYTSQMQGIRPNSLQIKNCDFNKFSILLPSIDEQYRIANFLDQKTAEIDEAIAKKQRLIELLKEQKAILINQTVTKGLNPDVPMRDSGVEWIGEVPAHWEVKRLGFLARLLQTGPFGSQLHQEEYILGGIPVINPSQLANGVIIPDSKTTVSKKTAERLSRHKTKLGDIIFARRGEMGRCGITRSNQEGYICGTGSILFRPNELTDPNFLNIAFSCDFVKRNLEFVSVGATMDNLNTSILSKISVPVPPKDEQFRIVESIKLTEYEFSKVMLLQQQSIDKLNEFKQLIVSEAVTGKIKI